MLIKINIPGNSYSVRVGESINDFGYRLGEFTSKERVVVVTNETIRPLYIDRLIASLEDASFNVSVIELDDGEEYKSLETVGKIYGRLSELKIERFTPVVGFGGGVVGDIAGFAASTYLRGLPFFNIPTSLIAQVDSSVGGKTGVNLESGKNLVGTFYQPGYVHIDVELMDTLDIREFKSGLAEVVKHAVIKGEKFLSYIEENINAILKREKDVLEVMVAECVRIKGEVVVNDEKEAGLRRILNFGHTVGHGLEASMGYGQIRHGEGVSIGMIAAAMISEQAGYGSKELVLRLKNLLSVCGLPVTIPNSISVDSVINVMYLDKKVRESNLEFVLPLKPGEVKAGFPVDEKIVREVIGGLVGNE